MINNMTNEDVNKNVLKSGTSILGIVCKDGVVIAGDRQSTAGHVVIDKNAQKVVPITDYLVVAGCGVASDIRMMEKILPAELRLKELRSKVRPTVKESANLLGMLNYKNIRQYSAIVNVVGMLLAGMNEDGTIELYSIEPAGTAMKVEEYDANFGSGMDYILGFLERQYKKGLTVKEGVELAIESLKASTQRDSASGYGIDIFTITKDGIKHAVRQKIESKFEND